MNKLYAIGINYTYYDVKELSEEDSMRIVYVTAPTVEEAINYVEQNIDKCFLMDIENATVVKEAWTEFDLTETGLVFDRAVFYPQ